jgi:hypothetical protein
MPAVLSVDCPKEGTQQKDAMLIKARSLFCIAAPFYNARHPGNRLSTIPGFRRSFSLDIMYHSSRTLSIPVSLDVQALLYCSQAGLHPPVTSFPAANLALLPAMTQTAARQPTPLPVPCRRGLSEGSTRHGARRSCGYAACPLRQARAGQ